MQLFELIAKAKKLQQGIPFIGEGKHKLILKTYELTEKKDMITGASKYALRAVFMVDQSAVHPAGSLVRASWRLDKVDWQLERELSRSQAFVMALLGTENPADVEAAGPQLLDAAQPARGIPVYAIGIATTSQKSGKSFVNVSWENCPYTPEEIVANRKRVEADSAPAPVATAPVQTAPVTQEFMQPPAAKPAGVSILSLLKK